MKKTEIVALGLTLLSPEFLVAQNAATLEVHFCPATAAWVYPLEAQRDIQSLVVQNIAMTNHGTVPIDIAEVDVSLMRGSEAVDLRRIVGDDLQRLAKSGPKIQAAGMLQLVGFQFCDRSMIAEGVKLAGPHLDPGQALLLTYQTFAFKGPRDSVQVVVHGHTGAQPVSASGSLPVRAGMSKTAFHFPLKGRWFVAVGPTAHTAHRWGRPEEFAFDIASLGDGNLSHRAVGSKFSNYYAYGAEVLAAANGHVVAAVNDIAENPALLRLAGDTDEIYASRMQEVQVALLKKGGAAVAGNYVVIDHGNSEYSLYAHLQPGSVRVKPSDLVRSGQPIAKLGSSGNSTEPHLHFQVCDAPAPLDCSGIPVNFEDIELPFADYPRPIQSGDIVVAK